MVFTWRKLYGGDGRHAAAPQLLPVVVTPEHPPVAAPPAPSAEPPSSDLIEIELPRGYRVRIGSNIKAAALRLWYWMRWSGDDRLSIECARLAGGRAGQICGAA